MTRTRKAPSLISAFTFVAMALLPWQSISADTAAKHGIAMHGDTRYPEGFPHFDYVNPDAPKGGTIRMAVVANGFDSFNPFVIRGVAAAGINTYVYDTLMEASADEPFSAYGLIAESIETPEDRSYVTFNLREEARFHDGEPITAEDVKFSFDVLTTKGHPFYRNYYADVTDVTIEDERRIRFDFAQTNNRELPLILGQLPVLPSHYWENREFGDNGLTPPVGSGPYRIGDFEPGRSITFERVEDYWAEDLGVRKGKFNFDNLQYDYYTDDTVALESFRAGNFDFRVESSAKNWATAYRGDQFESGKVKTEAVKHGRPAGMQAFAMNTRREVFSDPKVREALSYAFDFEWANKNLFYGQYTRTSSYFENSELASSGLPEGRELEILEPYRDQLPADVFTEAYQPPSTAGEGGLRDNLRTALTMLRDAGYAVKDGTMVNLETGQPLAFEILIYQKTFERVVLPFKNNLAKLGINVSVRLVDTNQYIQRIREFDYDMTVQGIGQSDSPGNEQREYWHSSTVDVKGSRNYMGVDSPVVDDLVNMVIQAPSREELVHRVRALDRVLLHGHYVIPNWYLAKDRIAYWSFLTRPDTVPKNGVDINNWWVKSTDQ
ncbi:extracellular solute-binding protein [Marinobacter sp. SS13-12]|uniref:extracellular solute-binding protein n=1 Tax=Marinobacter sp. SS13-12 TaxID=3050451 RepID=UPI002555F8A1|nr:extracellular solute-binding protein [Marinobacter sp. SS13-12]MDK8464364.1 extracellular solute-binding protein [Marinobacter sp. SS13-12]